MRDRRNSPPFAGFSYGFHSQSTPDEAQLASARESSLAEQADSGETRAEFPT